MANSNLSISPYFQKNKRKRLQSRLVSKRNKKEILFAVKYLNKIKQVVSSLLKGTEIKKKHRSRKAIPIAAAVEGAVGLLGTVILFGASDDCGIMGVFGSCEEKAQTNAKNIEKLEYTIAIVDNLQTQ